MNVWLFTRYLLALLLWLPVTPAFAEATSTEIEFWQSVKDSGDAEMLDAYLQEFPDGEFTELANIKIRKLSGATEVNYLWCATKSAVIKQTKASCNQLGGKSFDNKDSALDEKHRRNQVGSKGQGVVGLRFMKLITSSDLMLWTCLDSTWVVRTWVVRT